MSTREMILLELAMLFLFNADADRIETTLRIAKICVDYDVSADLVVGLLEELKGFSVRKSEDL